MEWLLLLKLVAAVVGGVALAIGSRQTGLPESVTKPAVRQRVAPDKSLPGEVVLAAPHRWRSVREVLRRAAVRPLAALLVGSVVAVVPLASPSSAAGGADRALNRMIDGPFTGSGTLDFSHPSCDGIYSEQDYIYGAGRPPSRSGTVHAEGCTDTSGSTWTVTSTFVITSRTGATLTGTIVGVATSSSFFNLYTVTGGTRQFRGVSGTISATATFDLGGPGLTNIEGTYVAALHR